MSKSKMISYFLTITKYPLSIVWALLILAASIGKPPSHLPNMGITFGDKVAHFAVYFILVILILWETKRQTAQKPTKSHLLKAFGFAAIYGTVMEILQFAFFPYRSFDLIDIFANITGCICGILIIALKK